MYKRCVDGEMKNFGPDHNSTLMAIGNLGELLIDSRKLEDAERLCRQSFEGFCKNVGNDHMFSLYVLNNLAVIAKLKEGGDFEWANLTHQECIEKMGRLYGKNALYNRMIERWPITN